jgi:hypothetical protein
VSDPEEGNRPGKEYEDSLDRHVEDVLNKPSKFRRTMKGVWAFLKTRMYTLHPQKSLLKLYRSAGGKQTGPSGARYRINNEAFQQVLAGIYGFCVGS